MKQKNIKYYYYCMLFFKMDYDFRREMKNLKHSYFDGINIHKIKRKYNWPHDNVHYNLDPNKLWF